MLDDTEYWFNIWRKSDLCFQKWHEEFSKFSAEHVWKCKNWNFDGILSSHLIYELKFYRGNLCHGNEEWSKDLKRNWFVSSKLTRGIWQILTRALENLKKLHFNRLLLTKVCNAWAKKSIEELCLMPPKLMQNLKEIGLFFLKIFV